VITKLLQSQLPSSVVFLLMMRVMRNVFVWKALSSMTTLESLSIKILEKKYKSWVLKIEKTKSPLVMFQK